MSFFRAPINRVAPALSDQQIADATTQRCQDYLRLQMEHLSTANKNRVLLALHAITGQELDALATDTHA
jgi:hypothetical protein